MLQVGEYIFKRANTDDEFEQIHALNHRTFVGEIGQYADTGGERLIDKFHHKNIYFIGMENRQVVGMVSVHGQPPFSIADRLPDPSILQQPDMRPLEVRLLAVDQERRNSVVLAGLVYTLYLYAQENGITHLFISGVKERLSLYEQLGFERIGPDVTSGNAIFVPMVCQVADIRGRKQRLFELWFRRLKKRNEGFVSGEGRSEDTPRVRSSFEVKSLQPSSDNAKTVCLLPGPVAIADDVHEAFRKAPIYHRGNEFLDLFDRVRRQLAELTRCRDVAILNGSGTLANEVVAATLAAEPQLHGMLLVNGEFGQRLAGQAARFGLSFETVTWPWGEPWDLAAVERRLRGDGRRVDWLWGVHQESSTGVMNDLPGLVEVARRAGCRVCVDCISSLGAVPLDLREVYLASGATGKCLGSYAGAALVFTDSRQLEHIDSGRTPSYLDLPAALRADGPRFTFPSSTLFAMEKALENYATAESSQRCYDRYRRLGQFVRKQLREVGLNPLANESCAAPVITTFAPPNSEASESFVARCQFWGYAIGGASSYLQARRLVQIATMGAIRPDDFAGLFDQMREFLGVKTRCSVAV